MKISDNISKESISSSKVEEDHIIYKLFNAIRELDVLFIDSFLQNLATVDKLVFAHPTRPNIKTVPVESYQCGLVNFIVFCDNNCPQSSMWIYCQVVSIVSAIIVDDKLIYGENHNEARIVETNLGRLRKFISKLKFTDLENDKSLQLFVSSPRPFHYIYDSLYWAYKLQKKSNGNLKIYYINPFLSLDSNVSEPTSSVLFKIGGINRNFITSRSAKLAHEFGWSDENLINFETELVKKHKYIRRLGNNLILWIGITGQKRAWLQQIKGYALIIKNLAKEYDNLYVKVDGLTSTLGASIDTSGDDYVHNEICKRVSSENVVIESLIGKDYDYKIKECSEIDLYVANSGTGCMIPYRFFDKPGVMHSNTKFNAFSAEESASLKLISPQKIIDMPMKLSDPYPKLAMNISYSIDWIEIYNELCVLIEHHYGKKITRLVPNPVGVVASQYSAENYYTHENKMCLIESMCDVSKMLKENYSLADLFRELAVAHENNFLLDQAKINIDIAKLLRPRGPVINKISCRINDVTSIG